MCNSAFGLLPDAGTYFAPRIEELNGFNDSSFITESITGSITWEKPLSGGPYDVLIPIEFQFVYIRGSGKEEYFSPLTPYKNTPGLYSVLSPADTVERHMYFRWYINSAWSIQDVVCALRFTEDGKSIMFQEYEGDDFLSTVNTSSRLPSIMPMIVFIGW
jgi:hypothetical protein